MILLKRMITAALCGTMMLGVIGCGAAEKPVVRERRKVIIDSDTGGDDATAILMALSEESVDVLGITVLAGNVNIDQAAANALMTVEIAGKETPVYKGAETNLAGTEHETFSIFGEDGMGDQNLIHPSREPETKNAVDFIIETVETNPGEVELIAIGPMTNIAMALEKQPDIAGKIKHIWFMGSAGLGIGNATPVAEFNAYKDAEACQLVLQSGVPMTVIGYDIVDARETWLWDKDFVQMQKGNAASQFVEKAFRKIVANKQTEGEAAHSNICDAVAMACILWPELVHSSIQTHAECITDETSLAYGQVLYFQQGVRYENNAAFDRFHVRLLHTVDAPAIKTKILATLNSLK